jgi:hypothetical protein
MLIERAAPGNAADSWAYRPQLTNYVLVGEYVYATIDNARPDDQVQGCTDHAHLLQPGWELADPNLWSTRELLRANSTTRFGSWCLAMRDGVGYKTDGTFGICGRDLLEIDAHHNITYWTMVPVSCTGDKLKCAQAINAPVYVGDDEATKHQLMPNTTWYPYVRDVPDRFFAVQWCNKRILVQRRMEPYPMKMGPQKILVLAPNASAFHLTYVKKILDVCTRLHVPVPAAMR